MKKPKKLKIKVPKARNPYVALAHSKKAGKHVLSKRKQRRNGLDEAFYICLVD